MTYYRLIKAEGRARETGGGGEKQEMCAIALSGASKGEQFSRVATVSRFRGENL